MEVVPASWPVQLVSLANHPPAVRSTVISSFAVAPPPKSRTTCAMAPGLPCGSASVVMVADWYVFWQRQSDSACLNGFESNCAASPSVTGPLSYLPLAPQPAPVGGERITATTAAPSSARLGEGVRPMTSPGAGA